MAVYLLHYFKSVSLVVEYKKNVLLSLLFQKHGVEN